MPASRDQVWTALAGIADPEIPVVNIVELGIVRDVQLDGGHAVVSMTPTFSGCPALHVMRVEIERVLGELGFAHGEVRTVLSPPWTSDWITPAARARLKAFGIAPPNPAGPNVMLVEPAACPRCNSADVTLRNAFGSTRCRAIFTCNSCRETFEQFKTI